MAESLGLNNPLIDKESDHKELNTGGGQGFHQY